MQGEPDERRAGRDGAHSERSHQQLLMLRDSHDQCNSPLRAATTGPTQRLSQAFARGLKIEQRVLRSSAEQHVLCPALRAFRWSWPFCDVFARRPGSYRAPAFLAGVARGYRASRVTDRKSARARPCCTAINAITRSWVRHKSAAPLIDKCQRIGSGPLPRMPAARRNLLHLE